MSFAAGVRLGPYEILGPLGAGEWARCIARATRDCNATVAIKVLPDAVASDPERLARFLREAQVLASLNHPHIANLHNVVTVKADSVGRRVCQLPESRMREVCAALGFALGCGP